jgi:hypothetical protein
MPAFLGLVFMAFCVGNRPFGPISTYDYRFCKAEWRRRALSDLHKNPDQENAG